MKTPEDYPEPPRPDGTGSSTKTTWDACVWQPPHLRKPKVADGLNDRLERLRLASERLRAAAEALRRQLRGPGGDGS